MVLVPFLSFPNKEINLPWYAYLMYVCWKVPTAVTAKFNMRPERKREKGNKIEEKTKIYSRIKPK
ncbi:hypothetical protein BO85DRAFT_306136 [Aspergillus piperis CBS 112811]|uniref:Uncharacterized protein n=1 Tax=Aspergillus piperis CBS 112811 TaxID=1448313 RepID=A0A8G1VMI5_9EURO|nr:hypothetical protein BO85DRAFT_306136 [Aspergillus piperis CBS 112811]RAH57562.1 hypothetical protein BO85DRAFT_306136 [Aspergillus piperis CBS 112811]